MIPQMKLWLPQQEIPEIWHELEGTWTEQETYGITAQILPGADHARSFPHEVGYRNGNLLQTEQASLMQSAITGNYTILFGSCGTHPKKPSNRRPWIGNNQVQLSGSSPEDEEFLISIMDNMAIEDVSSMEIQQGSVWLGVGEAARMCSISSPSQISLPHNNQSQAQENTDFSPFAPDYSWVDAQQVISNLPEIKECEFDHAYRPSWRLPGKSFQWSYKCNHFPTNGWGRGQLPYIWASNKLEYLGNSGKGWSHCYQ